MKCLRLLLFSDASLRKEQESLTAKKKRLPKRDRVQGGSLVGELSSSPSFAKVPLFPDIQCSSSVVFGSNDLW